jgi:hypothetical protein
MQLWETSGHAANYKDNMFVFEVGTSADAAEILCHAIDTSLTGDDLYGWLFYSCAD